jgi:pilus assembly protein CpaF
MSIIGDVLRIVKSSPGGMETLDERVRAAVREVRPLLKTADVDDIVMLVVARVTGLGPLAPLMAEDGVSDIMLNGDGRVWVERFGAVELTGITIDPETASHLIERIVAPLGRSIDRSSPVVDARLPDGSRVNAIVAPVAIDGPCLTIRRFAVRCIALSEFCREPTEAFLRQAVGNRVSMIISGGTGSGKTTLLNALAKFVPPQERIVTIEDAAELRLPGDHVVRLESQPGVEVTTRALVRNALRMRPDRIIVGECRGGEAFDMLQAMNIGHEGSMTTLHANSPVDALRRLETLVMLEDSGLPLAAVREQIDSAVGLVIQVDRCPDGSRQISEVSRVVGGSQRAETVQL